MTLFPIIRAILIIFFLDVAKNTVFVFVQLLLSPLLDLIVYLLSYVFTNFDHLIHLQVYYLVCWPVYIILVSDIFFLSLLRLYQRAVIGCSFILFISTGLFLRWYFHDQSQCHVAHYDSKLWLHSVTFLMFLGYVTQYGQY